MRGSPEVGGLHGFEIKRPAVAHLEGQPVKRLARVVRLLQNNNLLLLLLLTLGRRKITLRVGG
eukprot:COSAG05_NODE_8_length_40675_cov_148.837539_42_plen_63_part_00